MFAVGSTVTLYPYLEDSHRSGYLLLFGNFRGHVVDALNNGSHGRCFALYTATDVRGGNDGGTHDSDDRDTTHNTLPTGSL